MTTATDEVATQRVGLRQEMASSARLLGRITVLGLGLGLLVGGVLSRLAMLLLAELNPPATGVVSDDGFVMGQFTMSGSLNLLAVGGAFGVVGAGVYAALRGLMIGPRWFQVLSISLGPAVVVGNQIVHTSGVDFVLLEPAGLAIALFIALPAVYVAALSLVSERMLPEARLTSWKWVVPGLLVWAPLAPFFLILVAGRLALYPMHQTSVETRNVLAWLARGGLTVVFLVSLVDLVNKTSILL